MWEYWRFVLATIASLRLDFSVASKVWTLPASNRWEGNDGTWSTFVAQLGNPPQTIRLLPATSLSALFAVMPLGCNSTTDAHDCEERRGGFFEQDESSSWLQKGIFDLPIYSEKSWGYSGNGSFGFDDVVFGFPSDEGLKLTQTAIAGIATKDFFLGHFGLSPYALNFTDVNAPVPSTLQALKQQGQIPSLSWGYTAGASYSPKKTSGSLTLGGYDQSRFEKNNVTFKLAPDPSRDLLIAIQTITAGSENLLGEGIVALIDSTIGQIWLPIAACQRFEEVFGIEWDSSTNMYFINDVLHQELLEKDISLTLTLASNVSSADIVNIRLPYQAFDATADWPLSPNGSKRYFPIRRADDPSLYVLGRPFFQEAYVFVDHERGDFKISQAIMSDTGVASDLIEVRGLEPSKGGLSTAEQAGVAVAVGISAVLIGLGGWFWYRKRRHGVGQGKVGEDKRKEPFVRPKGELDGTSRDLTIVKPELAAEEPEKPDEAPTRDYELADSSTARSTSELHAAHLSEADAGWRGHAELPGSHGGGTDMHIAQRRLGPHELE